MQERTIDIDTGEGAMETFITQPEAGGPFPAVIVYMDIWGVREELYDIARRIATAGYCGIVPDFYYRQGRKRFDTRGPGGKLMGTSKNNLLCNRMPISAHHEAL
jgi:carboxymethylenebutenolidase